MADKGIAIRKSPARLSRGCRPRQRSQRICSTNKIRANLPAAGLSAALLILVAACSPGGNGSAGGSGSAGGTGAAGATRSTGAGRTGSAGAPLTARKALLATASQTQKVISAIETLTVSETGVQNASTTGRIQFRRTPTPLIGENLKLTSAGKSTEIKAILTGTAFYLNEASLTAKLGKPWLKLDLSALKQTPLGGIAQLVHSLQSNNFLNLTQLFAATKNARIVGKQTVDGVPTTEYAGSFRADQALKALSPAYRKVLAPGFQALGNTRISFHIWIDGQHYTRKAIEIETINGETIRTIVTVEAINQPVQIPIPPDSQTVTPPGA